MAGKLLVGQAGGATAVINSSLAGVIEAAQQTGFYDAIWGMRRGAEGALQGDLLDLSGLSAANLDALAGTPGAGLASSRHKVSDEEVDALLQRLQTADVRALVYIGGNDSADTIHRIARAAAARNYDLSAVAVPKTIDNDLPETDHSPGYGSIARFVAIATQDSSQDTRSMPTMYPVKFIEVMGRDAGWVVAAATLGKRTAEDAPHLIYVPEHRLSVDQLLADVAAVHQEYGYCVAVLAETVRTPSGESFADPTMSAENDAFGHSLLRGTADGMVRLVQQHLGLRARADRPGSLQRMAMWCASPVDLAEARAAGRAAVELARAGETDRMVTLVRDSDDPYASHTDSAPLSAVANRQRLLPSEFLSADGHGTTPAFHRYARPLLGPAPLPAYSRLHVPAAHWPA